MPPSNVNEVVKMTFDYSDLEPHEIALLALEYLKVNAHWLEMAAGECDEGEVSRVLAEVAEESHGFADDLDASIADHFGGRTRDAEHTTERLLRSADLVEADLAELTPDDMLVAATAEHEESYQFFMQEANEVEDSWVREVFEQLAQHARKVVVLLEEERERVQEDEL
jgi:hypothetical protein